MAAPPATCYGLVAGHSHPRPYFVTGFSERQILIITAGCGWAQRDGGPIEEIRPGDVVWFAPGEKHWHDATATTAMTQIAVRAGLDGKAVD